MKSISHIEVPKEWESDNDWDSHRGALWLAVNRASHDAFFEYGMGFGSTPLLKKWYTEINSLGKEYYSLETNREWANKFITEEYKPSVREDAVIFKNHCIFIIKEYFIVSLANAIVFVDSAPGEDRKHILSRNSDSPILIVHDSEPGASYVYDLEPTLSKFKYRLNYEPKGKPHTAIVSNYINVEEWQL